MDYISSNEFNSFKFSSEELIPEKPIIDIGEPKIRER